MKKLYTLILLMLLVFVSNAQVNFQKTLGTIGNDRNYSICKSIDGGYVMAGYTENFSATLDFYVIKTNALGEIEWSKTISNSQNQRAWQIICDQRGGYILAGNSSSPNNQADIALVIRLHSNGNLDWQTAISDTFSLALYGLKETKSGNIIATGLRKTLADSFDVYMAKLSPSGTLIQSKAYIHGGNQETFNLIEDSENNYISTGWYKRNGEHNSLNQMLFYKTDSNLNLISAYSFGIRDIALQLNKESRGYDLIEKDNKYYITGWNNDNLGILFEIQENILLANGAKVSNFSGSTLLFDIKQALDGDIVLGGYLNNGPAGGRDACMLKLRLNNTTKVYTPLYARAYGAGQTDGHWPSEILVNKDSTFSFLSSTNSFGAGNYDMYLTKTNSFGYASCNSYLAPTNFSANKYSVLFKSINPSELNIGTALSANLSDSFRLSTTSKICCQIIAPKLSDQFVCVGQNFPLLQYRDTMEAFKYNWFVNNTFYSSSASASLFINPSFDSAKIKLIVSTSDSLCGIDSVSFILKTPQKTVSNKEICKGETLNFKAPFLASNIRWVGNNTNISSDSLKIDYSDSIILKYSIKWCNYEDSFVVVVHKLPTFNIPDTSFCQYDSLKIVAPISGNYSWNFGSENGSSSVFYDSGLFTLTVLDSNQCAFTDSFFVSQKPSPAPFTFPPSDSICSNAEKILNAPYSFSNLVYSWNNGEHFGTTFRAIPDKTHSLVISNIYGCSVGDSVFIPSIFVPKSGVEKNYNACDKIVIRPNKFLNSIYKWNGMEGNDTILVNQSKTMFLEILHPNNCKSIDSIFVEIYPLPIFSLGNDTVICKKDSLLLVAPPDMLSYLWNNTITENTFIAKPPQKVILEVTNNMGCSFVDSIFVDSIHCENLSVYKRNKPINLKVYPNPAKTEIYIDYLNEEYMPETIDIFSVLGSKLLTIKILPNQKFQKIDVSELPNGVYNMLLYNDKNHLQTCKFVVNK
jgi:hypothetical protein